MAVAFPPIPEDSTRLAGPPEPVLSPSPPLGRVRVDLHCHSEASPDCSTPLALLPARCKEQGIQVQAITDHNAIWGAQKLQDLVRELSTRGGYPLTVIVGEEISTREGEIIGLFLREVIPAGLSPEETVWRIKRQEGLVLLPHGFDPLKRYRLRAPAIARIANSIDLVETFNARISRPHWNREAARWAQAHGALSTAGSDSHTLADIGTAWVETPALPIQTPQDLLTALQGGIPQGRWMHPIVAFVFKMWDRTRRRLYTAQASS